MRLRVRKFTRRRLQRKKKNKSFKKKDIKKYLQEKRIIAPLTFNQKLPIFGKVYQIFYSNDFSEARIKGYLKHSTHASSKAASSPREAALQFKASNLSKGWPVPTEKSPLCTKMEKVWQGVFNLLWQINWQSCRLCHVLCPWNFYYAPKTCVVNLYQNNV